MLQITSKNFSKKRLSIKVKYGKKITGTASAKDDVAEQLFYGWKAKKKVEIHMDFKLNTCAFCEETWSQGDFAIEKLLLIPKNGEGNKKGGKPARLTVTIPRVVCLACSQSVSEEDQEQREETATSSTLASAWRVHNDNVNQDKNAMRTPSMTRSPPVRYPAGNRPAGAQGSPHPSTANNSVTEQMEKLEIAKGEGATAGGSGSVTPKSDVPSLSDHASESMVDQKGFLVCTQLVKTGGADRAGLQVGDIFARFGPLIKSNFRGLKQLATFVRGSANESIEAVVLRRMTDAGQRSQRGATFQRIRLHLTPLNSHDADGGGVLGAVMNIWPLPKPASSNPHP